MQNTPINNNGIMPGQTAKEWSPTPADNQSGVANVSILGLSRTERLKLAINDLQIGQRIQDELKRQGRTVTWLANQLGMERTSLYYTFRQSSINLELLMRISCFLEHNFLQDVVDVFKAYGLRIVIPYVSIMNQNFQNMQNTSLSHKCATAHLAESCGCGFRTPPIQQRFERFAGFGRF